MHCRGWVVAWVGGLCPCGWASGWVDGMIVCERMIWWLGLWKNGWLGRSGDGWVYGYFTICVEPKNMRKEMKLNLCDVKNCPPFYIRKWSLDYRESESKMYHASRAAEMRFLNPAEQWLCLHILRVAREGCNFWIYPRTTVEFSASGKKRKRYIWVWILISGGTEDCHCYVQIIYTKRGGTKAYWENYTRKKLFDCNLRLDLLEVLKKPINLDWMYSCTGEVRNDYRT